MKKRSPEPKPTAKVRVMPPIIHVFGIPYFISWDRVLPGCSFFLKTTASASEVKRVLRPYARRCNYELEAQNRCEFGYYGVRVWRLA